MKAKKCLALIIALLATAMTASAQKDGVYSFIGKKNRVNLNDSARLYKTLLENTPIEPEFKYEPHFAVVGYGGRFFFSTGARLRFTASYDLGNPVQNPQSTGVSLLEDVWRGNRHLFQMSAGSSNLYFNIIGFPHSDNQVGLFVRLDLDAENNNSYRVKAGHIYMRYRNFLCGYTSSLYNDRGADPFMITDDGICSSGAHSCVQINYQRALSKHLTMGVGVELPPADYTRYCADSLSLDKQTKILQINQRVPDIPFYFQYSWNQDAHLRLSGVLRTINHYDWATDDNRYDFGWGAKLTGKCKMGPVTLYGMFQGGRAIANYMVGNDKDELDLVPYDDPGHAGRMRATYSIGGMFAAQYDILPNLFVTGQFSGFRNYTDRYLSKSTTEFDEHTRRGMSLTATAVWRISDLFSAAAEYVHVRRNFEGQPQVRNNRFYAMFMMTF